MCGLHSFNLDGQKIGKARAVVLVRLRPGSYTVLDRREESIATQHPVDPKFSNNELEWIVNEQGADKVYGLLIKVDLDDETSLTSSIYCV